ncbi:Hypp723 [Branchiostoma lanceolatum]|uniref:Hypp723 protein n=1 Tax=Branchiostoma lanceolatum TaxID=7740 RepID=A0A8J9VNI3_BRALA|nr:Hypp723 [Branchiostoma lanceolatum]
MDDICVTEVGEKRKRPRQYCGHCDQLLGNSSFYTHKRLFFKDGKWTKSTNSKTASSFIELEDTEVLADNTNEASCSTSTHESLDDNFYQSDVCQHDGDGDALGTLETVAVEREEIDGWLEEEDLQLCLSESDSDSDSSDQDNLDNTEVNH